MIITILISVRIGTYKLCCDEKDIRVMLKYNVPFFACFFSHCTFTLQFYIEMIIFRASNFIKSKWWILVCYLRRVWKFCVNFSLLNPDCFHQFTSLGGLIECTNVNTWNKDRFRERFWLQNWQLTHRPGHTTPRKFHERSHGVFCEKCWKWYRRDKDGGRLLKLNLNINQTICPTWKEQKFWINTNRVRKRLS